MSKLTTIFSKKKNDKERGFMTATQAAADTPKSPFRQHKIPFLGKTVQTTYKQQQSLEKTAEHRSKMQDLAKNSETVLLQISTVFPFDFFPDQISIETTQVNIVRSDFFFDHSIQSIPIKNILEVRIQDSILFSSLTLLDNAYQHNEVTISYLKKGQANKARRIIQGLVIASKEGVDCSTLEVQELAELSERLGTAQSVEP